jgi:hypothetical protein
MVGDGPTVPLSVLLHDLAERLQAMEMYLSAAHRIGGHNKSDQDAITDAIDKAVGEFRRALTAFHQLRLHLATPNPQAGDGQILPMRHLLSRSQHTSSSDDDDVA